MANKDDLPKVYFDACCFIDVVKFEVSAPLDDATDAWYTKRILPSHKAGEIVAYTSTLSIAECLDIKKGSETVPTMIQDHFRRLLTSGQYVTLLPQTPRTYRMVQDLRWVHNLSLSGKDAIHIAAFLDLGIDEFLTGDQQLKSDKMSKASAKLSQSGRRFCRPSDTQCLPLERLQGDIGDIIHAQ